MSGADQELVCRRCDQPVRASRDHYEVFERMHYVCFHYEFEHDPADPDDNCGVPGCPSPAAAQAKDPQRLVLMCGLPGSGKTTLAKFLESELPAVRLCPDEWMVDLGIDLFDEQSRDRLEKVFWRLAQDLLRLGQSVVLESGFWLRSDRDEKRFGARAVDLSRIGHADCPPPDRQQQGRYYRRFKPPVVLTPGQATRLGPVHSPAAHGDGLAHMALSSHPLRSVTCGHG
jgi:predicted kinase